MPIALDILVLVARAIPAREVVYILVQVEALIQGQGAVHIQDQGAVLTQGQVEALTQGQAEVYILGLGAVHILVRAEELIRGLGAAHIQGLGVDAIPAPGVAELINGIDPIQTANKK